MVEGAWGSSEFDRPEEGSIAGGVWCCGERRRRKEDDPAFLYQLSIIPPVSCCDAGGGGRGRKANGGVQSSDEVPYLRAFLSCERRSAWRPSFPPSFLISHRPQ